MCMESICNTWRNIKFYFDCRKQSALPTEKPPLITSICAFFNVGSSLSTKSIMCTDACIGIDNRAYLTLCVKNKCHCWACAIRSHVVEALQSPGSFWSANVGYSPGTCWRLMKLNLETRLYEIQPARQLQALGQYSVRLIVKASVVAMASAILAFIGFRIYKLFKWEERRTTFDGQDSIAFCAHCSPQLVDDQLMSLGNAYEKRFFVPASCPRCSWFWLWRGWRKARVRIGNTQYQFLGTYTALRMQRDRDVHCPAVNQLDVNNEYRFAHRFLQLHVGTLGKLEEKQRWWYTSHTRSYCLSTQWEEVPEGDYTKPTGMVEVPPDDQPPPVPLSYMQKMRQYWDFVIDNNGFLPQSTMVATTCVRIRTLMGNWMPVPSMTSHMRLANADTDSRVNDATYLTPPEGVDLVPVGLPSAQAVGPLTHNVTIHNAADKPSVVAALEGRSLGPGQSGYHSVFAAEDGTFPALSFKRASSAARRLRKFWKRFFAVCLTSEAIERAYQKHFAGKTFEEIVFSRYSQEEVKEIQTALQTTTKAEEIGTRKANGKIESVMKSGKPARLVIDNTLQLMAVNIIAATILQHIIFDHNDGIFYSMSIKHRSREDVLDAFGKMMQDPFGDEKRERHGKLKGDGKCGVSSTAAANTERVTGRRVGETCAWEIDQTGMELHQRCNKHGVGILGYAYDALTRINSHITRKINSEFTELHEAKIELDIKTGMKLRFRIKSPDVPKDRWFTATFPDLYLDSGWILTSAVNFINELSGVFSSIVENPEHLFAQNPETGAFRLQDGTFDWRFKSIPLFQTLDSPAPSAFAIYLKGIIEGDDGAGAASRCIADPRNGGDLGLIVREQEDLGYSGKFKPIVLGRLEFIGAHYPVENGLVTDQVPWIPAVKRYTSKLSVQTNVNITASSKAARFLSLASMFAGRIEPLQRGFEQSAMRIIEEHGKEKDFWTRRIRTDGYNEIDRAFGSMQEEQNEIAQIGGILPALDQSVLATVASFARRSPTINSANSYSMNEIKAHFDRMSHRVHPSSNTQIRMLNMSLAEDVNANLVTREDFAKLGLFADTCRTFDADHESSHSMLPACFR